MSTADRAPHPALRRHVGRYVGFDLTLDPRAVHYGSPSAAATVVLSFAEPIDSAWADEPPGGGDRFRALAAGLHLRPALVRTHGRQYGMQLDLTPLGTRALLGVPMGALSGVMAHHEDLPFGIPEPVCARLAAAASWGDRFDLLDEHLLARLRRGREATAGQRAAHEAWGVLAASGGRLSVADLSAQVGWSRRHLASLFAAEFGTGPKAVARLHRFTRARALVGSGAPMSRVAADAGYADQAHLSREWKSLAGRPPSLSEEFPIDTP